MSKNIWLISDHHLSHKNIIKFESKLRPGELMRPGFRDIHHHNKFLTECHNSVVKTQDHVWLGGDFGDPECAKHLNGHLRLILGNHDVDKQKIMKTGRFEKVAAWRRWNIGGVSFVHTHFPLYMPNSINSELDRGYNFNVHGHIHEFTIRLSNGLPDPRYLNVCVEQLQYVPINIEDVAAILKKRLEF